MEFFSIDLELLAAAGGSGTCSCRCKDRLFGKTMIYSCKSNGQPVTGPMALDCGGTITVVCGNNTCTTSTTSK